MVMLGLEIATKRQKKKIKETWDSPPPYFALCKAIICPLCQWGKWGWMKESSVWVNLLRLTQLIEDLEFQPIAQSLALNPQAWRIKEWGMIGRGGKKVYVWSALCFPWKRCIGAGACLPPGPRLSIKPPAWLWQAADSCKFKAYI